MSAQTTQEHRTALTVRPWLTRIEPYRPGRKAPGADGAMASNESALGTSPAVAAAVMAALPTAHRYPDPLADALRERLAERHGVPAESILVGNGSDELIGLLATAYAAHGGSVVCAHPAYRIDEISAHVVDAQVVRVPLVDDRHDLAAMAQVPADIAYLVNPHNPTGTTYPLEAVAEFVAASRAGLVVVDEAYIDFTDEPDATTAMALRPDPRVAVLRTFSKIHGLAGLRVGYLVADPEIIAVLRSLRAPFSVGALAQAAAVAALDDEAHAQRVREHTLRLRPKVAALLAEAGLQPAPSQSNFVLAHAPADGAVTEQQVVDHLAAHGSAVRPGTALGIPDAVRVSVPTDAGLALLERALAALPRQARH